MWHDDLDVAFGSHGTGFKQWLLIRNAAATSKTTNKLQNHVNPVLSYCVAAHLTFHLFSRQSVHTLLLNQEMFIPILVFLHFLVFELQAHTGQTDRWTDGWPRPITTHKNFSQLQNYFIKPVLIYFSLSTLVKTTTKTITVIATITGHQNVLINSKFNKSRLHATEM